MALREIALTVLELERLQFYWVLMEAVEADADDCLVYRPVDSSTQPFRDYSEALVAGTVALRQLQGIASLGQPVVRTGIGEILDEARTSFPSHLASMV